MLQVSSKRFIERLKKCQLNTSTVTLVQPGTIPIPKTRCTCSQGDQNSQCQPPQPPWHLPLAQQTHQPTVISLPWQRCTHLVFSKAEHVHGPHVDALRQSVPPLPQLPYPALRLLRVVGRKVVQRAGPAEQLALLHDPVVSLQKEGDLERSDTDPPNGNHTTGNVNSSD